MIDSRLLKQATKEKKYIALVVLFQWISLLVQVFIVFGLAKLVSKVLEQRVDLSDCFFFLMMVVIGMGIRYICEKQASSYSFLASCDVKIHFRKMIYHKLLAMGSSYRQFVKSSEIAQLASEGVEQLETYFGKYLPQLFYSMLAPITLFFILMNISMKASLILFVCVPLIPLSIVLVQKIAKRLLKQYWSMYTGLGDSFLDHLKGLTTLKVFGCDQVKQDYMDEESQVFRNVTMKVLCMQLNSTSVMDILAYGGAGIGIGVALYEYVQQVITLPQSLCIILLASEFFIPLRLLGSFFHIAMNAMAASNQLFTFLDLEEAQVGTLQPSEYSLVLKDVSFSYDNARDILKHINMKVEQGSLVSIVGKSGCGKSTIAKVVAKRVQGYQGSVLFGGCECSNILEEAFYQHVVVVNSSAYFYKGSVRECLLMANEHASEQEMWDVLERVQISAYFKEQQGLDTLLVNNASNLSGGQRQRLAIARALLKDCDFYIFDEACANIDQESENLIMQVIYELAKEKAILFISHRLENVVGSNQIYFVEDGEILEQGTHETLMRNKGAYAELYLTQKALEHFGGEACE